MSPSDNSNYGSSILTDAEFEKMLADAERQDAINAKRQRRVPPTRRRRKRSVSRSLQPTLMMPSGALLTLPALMARVSMKGARSSEA